MPFLFANQLKRCGIKIFNALGASEEEARTVTEFLVKANLVGHDSHGIIRIIQYTRAIQKGEIIPKAPIKIVHENSSSALLNGNWGFGQVICKKAMEIAIKKAKENTISVVCVHNCNHVGRLADYTMMAVENDMIGLAMVNSNKLVAPYGGIERMLSTAPLCYAFPTDKETPFVLDIATSICAEGKIRVSLHKNEKLSEKWIINKNGKPSNNPVDLYEGGAILPFGGKVGYKGFGLGLVVEILTGILAGATPAYLNQKRGNGVFLIVINIEDFLPLDQFTKKMDQLIRAVKKSKIMPGFEEILIPGEPEIKIEKKRIKKGISIPEKTWSEITEIAKKLEINIKNIF